SLGRLVVARNGPNHVRHWHSSNVARCPSRVRHAPPIAGACGQILRAVRRTKGARVRSATDRHLKAIPAPGLQETRSLLMTYEGFATSGSQARIEKKGAE